MSYSKYSAKPTFVDGIRFASKKEAARYEQLLLLVRGNVIKDLKLQPRFQLIVNEKKVCTYVADFEYLEDGRRVVEDAKGMRTRDYIIKHKLLMALNPGLDHREI